MNRFVQGNPNLCIGCRTCMIGCVVAHEGKHIFEVDPDSIDFHPKLKVIKTPTISVPVQCKHCENPACMAVCRSGAIYRADGAIIIDESKCIGCKSCADACPYGCVEMVTLKSAKGPDGLPMVVANKCDLCANVSGASGGSAGPTCLRVCPTEALKLIEEEDVNESVQRKRIAAANSSALLVSQASL